MILFFRKISSHRIKTQNKMSKTARSSRRLRHERFSVNYFWPFFWFKIFSSWRDYFDIDELDPFFKNSSFYHFILKTYRRELIFIRKLKKIRFQAAWRSIFTENLKTRLPSFRSKISQTTTFRRSIRRSLKIPARPRASSAKILPTKTTT